MMLTKTSVLCTMVLLCGFSYQQSAFATNHNNLNMEQNSIYKDFDTLKSIMTLASTDVSLDYLDAPEGRALIRAGRRSIGARRVSFRR